MTFQYVIACLINMLVTRYLKVFLQSNELDALISRIYFWNRTLHVMDSFSVHHKESSTEHTAIGTCHIPITVCTVLDS